MAFYKDFKNMVKKDLPCLIAFFKEAWTERATARKSSMQSFEEYLHASLGNMDH